MSPLKRDLELLQFYGLKGGMLKVWEKLIVDRKRFKSKMKRSMPDFSAYSLPKPVGLPQTDYNEQKLTIWYLVHCFYPTHTGGTERFVYNLAKQQQQAGHAVKIITLSELAVKKFTANRGEIFYREVDYKGLPVIEFRYRKTPVGLYYKVIEESSALKEFAQYHIKQERPDIVHCAYPQPFAGFLTACREEKIPYILTLTDFNIFCHYATMVKQNGQFCAGCQEGRLCEQDCPTRVIGNPTTRYHTAKQIMENAAAVVTPSEFVAKIIHKEFPAIIPYVIPHGLGEGFSNDKSRKQTKRIIYAGALSELKGVHLLIEAFRKIEGNVTLDILGTGNSFYVKRLHKLAKGDARIQFVGVVPPEKMQQIYRTSDCVVVPSIWYETYSFVLREALACGCIVIASDIGAMPEAIIEGKNGFLFRSGNVEDLQCVLQKAINFDWHEYYQASFPSLQDEGNYYQALYGLGKINDLRLRN